MGPAILAALIKYGKVALRHVAVIGTVLIIGLIITGEGFSLFSAGLFLPLAAFATFAIPFYRGVPATQEIIIGAFVIVIAHFICVGGGAVKLLFLLLYGGTAALGAAFGFAVRQLGKKKEEQPENADQGEQNNE